MQDYFHTHNSPNSQASLDAANMNGLFKLLRPNNLSLPNVFQRLLMSSNVIRVNVCNKNIVSSSCRNVEIRETQLDKFVFEKSVELHAEKLALVTIF